MNKLIDYFKRLKEKGSIKKGKDSFSLIEVALIVALTIFISLWAGVFVTYHSLASDYEQVNEFKVNKGLEPLNDIYELILNKYYQEVDQEKLIKAAIEGMLLSLNDPNSIFFDVDEKQSFDERMSGEYHGIGIELIETTSEITIVNVFRDTPAFRAGLKPFDVIMMVDNKDAKEMGSSKLASYIKYQSGSKVDLEINRKGEVLSFTVTKEDITLTSVISELFNINNRKIGYLGISLFASNTYQQFKEALILLENQKIDSLVIDVRNNSGGYLDAVEKMIALFLPKDSIVFQTRENQQVIKHYDKTVDKRSYKVVVLINDQSASASEILAAAFKESYQADIVGVKSYGKGTVQETKDVNGGAMIKFTTQEWLSPNGNSIEAVGIEPTITINLDEKYWLDPVYENDNQLQKALEILSK